MVPYKIVSRNKTISVHVHDNGGAVSEGLAPGQFDRARELLPEPLYEEVRAIWTPEVVAAWVQSKQQEAMVAQSDAQKGKGLTERTLLCSSENV